MSTQYHYEPLGPCDFRILHIRPGRKHDPIQCCLQTQNFHTSLDAEYSALSYAWGSTDRTQTIMLEGFSFPVTHNLHSALWHARDRKKRVSLWADAVCINQTDKDERGHQVVQMRSIYRAAAQVIIWLGEATVESDNAMEFICLEPQTEICCPTRMSWNCSIDHGGDASGLSRKSLPLKVIP
jgi:hypothetical protein